MATAVKKKTTPTTLFGSPTNPPKPFIASLKSDAVDLITNEDTGSNIFYDMGNLADSCSYSDVDNDSEIFIFYLPEPKKVKLKLTITEVE